MSKQTTSMPLNEVVHLLSQQESVTQLARAYEEIFSKVFQISDLGILEISESGHQSTEGQNLQPMRIGRRASPGFEKKERLAIISAFRQLLKSTKVQEKQLDSLHSEFGRIDFFLAPLAAQSPSVKRQLLLYWRRLPTNASLSLEESEMMLTTCVVIASQWLWIDRLHELERSRLHDELTGLYNQKYLDVVLEHELRRGERFAARFAVVFIDLDDFKSVNDRYGHLAGSYVLQQMGTLLRETLREVDSIVRYGGDEYVVVLLGADQYTAMLAAERIRATVAGYKFKVDEDVSVQLTCSLGVACYPDHGRTKKALLEAADSQLYRSKHRGKNRVTAFVDSEKTL